jgi:hypothetical protein
LAAAASSLVVGGRGGTGLVPTLSDTRAHLATAPGPEPDFAGAAPPAKSQSREETG